MPRATRPPGSFDGSSPSYGANLVLDEHADLDRGLPVEVDDDVLAERVVGEPRRMPAATAPTRITVHTVSIRRWIVADSSWPGGLGAHDRDRPRCDLGDLERAGAHRLPPGSQSDVR